MKQSFMKALLALPIFFNICAAGEAMAQKLFYCDSTFVQNDHAFVSECATFYDFFQKNLDSIDRYSFEKDTFYNLIIKLVAPVNSKKKIDGVVFGLVNVNDTVFKISYVDGLANGPYIRLNHGDTVSVTCLKNGRKDGIEWFKHSAKGYSTQTYKEGVPAGPFLEMEAGQLRSCSNYKNGLAHGAQYEFHDNGRLAWLLVYEKGKVADGEYHRFDENGEVVETRVYKNGKIKKDYKYPNGVKKIVKH